LAYPVVFLHPFPSLAFCLAEGKQSRGFHPALWFLPLEFLSTSLRLIVFSNPEQIRRCSQGREAPHQLSSERPWEGGAPEIRQLPGPTGLCSPSVS
jgi:hypothetical protein